LLRLEDKLQLCSAPEYAPFISKTLEHRKPPMLSQLHVLDERPCDDTQPISPIGYFSFADMQFDVYQGNSGHVPGETLLFDEEHKVAITGDDYVNHRGFRMCAPGFAPKYCSAAHYNLNRKRAAESLK